jgi:hypothetical protein
VDECNFLGSKDNAKIIATTSCASGSEQYVPDANAIIRDECKVVYGDVQHMVDDPNSIVTTIHDVCGECSLHEGGIP